MDVANERRRHKRIRLDFPAVLSLPGNKRLDARAADISDGGMLVILPDGALDGASTSEAPLGVELALPRTTPNTRMVERIRCAARVVRRQQADKRRVALALRFTPSQALLLEV